MTSFDNSAIRNTNIWTPFQYYGSYNDTQTAERAIIFGLYSNSWRNDDAYIQGVSDIEMANILADYNLKIAGLTTDEQKVLSDISAKRYISQIDTLIHNEKMATKLQKINADADEWDAKIAALSADRAELETLRVKIAAETKRIAARILELTAHIQTEKAHYEMVRIEISEKEIQKAQKDIQLAEKELEEAKRDIEILSVANEIARVQIQIVEAGLELIDIDMKVARGQVDLIQLDSQISKAGLTASELLVAEARTEAEGAELGVLDARLNVAEKQVDIVDAEIDGVQSESTDDAAIHDARLEELDARQTGKLRSLENSTEKTLFNIQERDVTATLDRDINALQNTAQSTMDADKMRIQDAHVDAARTKLYAAVAAQQLLAEASIVSTLIHTIKKQ